MKKKIVFLLGFQKCGTTWLYNLLLNQPSYINNRFAEKELNVWKNYKTGNFLSKLKKSNNLLQFLLFVNPKFFYFKYFKYLIKENHFSSDISPSNCILVKKDINNIKEKFNNSGIEVKFIAFIRDPLQRCLSAFNMYKIANEKNGSWKKLVSQGNSLDEKFNFFFKTKNCSIRTQYEKILNEVSCLGRDDFKMFIYEDFFFNNNSKALKNYLSINYDDQFNMKVIFSKKQDFTISKNELKNCVLFYKNTYQIIKKKFPKVQKLWDGFKYL